MADRRKVPSTRQSRRVSRDVRDSTIGSHVQRTPTPTRRQSQQSRGAHTSRYGSTTQVDVLRTSAANNEIGSTRHTRSGQRQYAEVMQRRANKRRFVVIAIVAIAIVAIALVAGFLAFRGSVGSSMALRDSDASQALVPVHSDEPYYALITAELGAVAEPLEHEGPDEIFLARVDRQQKTLALVAIPPGLQVATDSGARRVADLASKGDAALISAIANFAKVDISHYVKVKKGGLETVIDKLEGIDVNIDQVIDDPHAGDVYLPVGLYTLTGQSALTYLRADNLRLGVNDQLQHQVDFAALVLEKVFSSEGNFATRLESIDECFETDLSMGDIESLQSWIRDLPANSIVRVALPGYLTEVTGVVDTGDALFIASQDSMASIIASLESGTVPDTTSATEVQPAQPGGFTIEVQNGTNINGAATLTADTLTAAGFNVVQVGNAEQPVYDETLVIYKGEEGPGRAKAIINTLGVGRAVSDMYYSFDTDILVIVGADYKPFV